MPAFYLTLLAVLLAGFGARDQVTIAGLALRQGQRPATLIVGLVTMALATVAVVFAATLMLAELPPPARAIFVAIALGMAGLESLVLVPRRDPKEPTNSLGALGFVLLVHQVTDAARFLVFGMGVGMAAPYASGVAGLLGGAVLTGFAWALPQVFDKPFARWLRRVVGAVLVLVALGLLLSEFHIL